MKSIEELLDAKKAILMNKLEGKEIDFTDFRKVCEEYDDNSSFKLEGTDAELFKSVNRYINKLLLNTEIYF